MAAVSHKVYRRAMGSAEWSLVAEYAKIDNAMNFMKKKAKAQPGFVFKVETEEDGEVIGGLPEYPPAYSAAKPSLMDVQAAFVMDQSGSMSEGLVLKPDTYQPFDIAHPGWWTPKVDELQVFFDAYKLAILHEDHDDHGHFLDDEDIEFSPVSEMRMLEDCTLFWRENRDLILKGSETLAKLMCMAGTDFWQSRQGQAGFSDREEWSNDDRMVLHSHAVQMGNRHLLLANEMLRVM